jgi:hypothetical protein
MKRLIYLSVIILLAGGGCTQKSGEENTLRFERANFKQVIKLENPEEIEIKELLDPVSFHLMHDSIIVVGNQVHCEYLIELYSLNTGQVVAQLAGKGGGPEDVASCTVLSMKNTGNTFTFKDESRSLFFEINLNSTLANKRLHIEKNFQYAPNIRQGSEIYCTDDTHYVGYNMWYLNHPIYTNKVPPLQIYPTDPAAPAPENLSEYSCFVASVNDAHVYFNPSAKKIWLLDGHRDRITIYDDSLHIQKTIEGPDYLEPAYITRQSNIPMPFVSFDDDGYYGAYTGFTATDEFIYAIYQGLNGEKLDPAGLRPVEVFKFDSEGNPLTC